MRNLILILVLLPLGGCAFDDMLRNRVSCTIAGDEALYSSMYGWIGVTSEIDPRDAEVLCKPQGEK